MPRTFYQLLNGKKITNVYDGRPDGSILVRLNDRTEVVIRKAIIIDGEEMAEIKQPCGEIRTKQTKDDNLPLTVGQLMDKLAGQDKDTLVGISNSNEMVHGAALDRDHNTLWLLDKHSINYLTRRDETGSLV